MNHSRARVLVVCGLLIAIASSGFFYHRHLRYQAMHAMPNGLFSFRLSDPLPICARWKEHMPANRSPATYRLYIEARKLWRSKIEWQLTHAEALQILTDVNLASQKGDWGARALMSYFYLHGLGPLDSNHVLDPDPVKAIELTRMAVAAGQPWGFYDLGVAYEHGYGGVPYDEDIAWAYYLKAAQLGSPEAQMALADAYLSARRFEDEEFMMRCAYEQGHGPAAYKLAIKKKGSERYLEAIKLCQDGVKFGDENSASSLQLLFTYGYWFPDQKKKLLEVGIKADLERSMRYGEIADVLEINPDLKLTRLDQTLPLPPEKLPDWKGVDDALELDSSAPPAY